MMAAAAWVRLEDIRHGEISSTQKDRCRAIALPARSRIVRFREARSPRVGGGVGEGRGKSVLSGDNVSVGSWESPEDGGWSWLHSSVTVRSAPEPSLKHDG